MRCTTKFEHCERMVLESSLGRCDATIRHKPSLTLNANNVLDQDPPYSISGQGFMNGSTFGRFVQVGIRNARKV